VGWLQRMLGRPAVERDPGRQQEILRDLRAGVDVRLSFHEQASALLPVLGGDDGLVVAARVVGTVAGEAGPALFGLPCGFHPYVHLTAALTVIADDARQCVRLTDPGRLQGQALELLALTAAGWESGRVPVDADAARLARVLIAAAGRLRTAMPDPPPLPASIRALMRRNNTTDILDLDGEQVIGGINLGAELRPALLI